MNKNNIKYLEDLINNFNYENEIKRGKKNGYIEFEKIENQIKNKISTNKPFNIKLKDYETGNIFNNKYRCLQHFKNDM
jgi:hypothetical protein